MNTEYITKKFSQTGTETYGGIHPAQKQYVCPLFHFDPYYMNYILWVTGGVARQQVGQLMPPSVMLMLTMLTLCLQPLISSILQSSKPQPALFFFLLFFVTNSHNVYITMLLLEI